MKEYIIADKALPPENKAVENILSLKSTPLLQERHRKFKERSKTYKDLAKIYKEMAKDVQKALEKRNIHVK